MKNYIDIKEKFYDYADVLNVYATQARYPNEQDLEDRKAGRIWIKQTGPEAGYGMISGGTAQKSKNKRHHGSVH